MADQPQISSAAALHDHNANPTTISDVDAVANLQSVYCGGCKKQIESEGGGVVVAFGSSLWHVECFQCAKCLQRVNADTNLLLLADGSPVCSNCSYSCNICKQPILDEAIMTGDDSYHATCFTCRSCSRRIEELVFAKTTQGIYCMDCHNERVARSRRHAEKRSKSKGGSQRDKDRRKERPIMPDGTQTTTPKATEFGLNHHPSPPTTPQSPNMSMTMNFDHSFHHIGSENHAYPQPAKRISTQLIPQGLENIPPNQRHQHQQPHSADPTKNAQHPSVNFPPRPSVSREVSAETVPSTRSPATRSPESSQSAQQRMLDSINMPPPISHRYPEPQPPARHQQTLPLPALPNSSASKRRKSFNDGVVPKVEIPSQQGTSMNGPSSMGNNGPLSPSGLGVPGQTSRADKRRSISPGLWLGGATPHIADTPRSPTAGSEGRLSPYAMSPSAATLSFATNDLGSPPGASSSQPRAPSPTHHPPRPSSQSSSRSNSPAGVPSSATAATLSAPQSGNAALMASTGSARPLPPRTKSLPENRAAEDAKKEVNGTQQQQQQQQQQHPQQRSERKTSSSSRHSPSSTEKAIPDVSLDGPPAPPPKAAQSSSQRGTVTDGPMADSPQTSAPAGEPPQTDNPSMTLKTPALPPMRFSFNSTDFSSLLMSVDNNNATGSKGQQRPDGAAQGESPSDSQAPLVDGSGAPSSSTSTHPLTSIVVTPTSEPSEPPALIVHDTGDSVESDPAHSHASHANNHQDPHRLGASTSHGLTNLPNSSTSSLSGDMAPRSQNSSELVTRRLREALVDATERGSTHVKLDREFVDAIIRAIEGTNQKNTNLRGEVDQAKRASLQYVAGLTVAHDEYQKELAGRRDAEAEVTRLRVQLSGQAARLTAMSAADRQRDMMDKISKDMNTQIRVLERELSKLKVDRDQRLVELEEVGKLSQSTSSIDSVTHGLSNQLDTLKSKYRTDLEPLKHQREALHRELSELKEARDIFLEETTALNARNEELAQLNAQIARQIELSLTEVYPENSGTPEPTENGFPKPPSKPTFTGMFSGGKPKPLPSNSSITSVGSSTMVDERSMATKAELGESGSSVGKKFKWFGAAAKNLPSLPDKAKKAKQHSFQQTSILRIARCDHCGDKLWGAQFRCSDCSMTCHPRCVNHVSSHCTQTHHPDDSIIEVAPLPPSMFGRDLTEQVRADADRGGDGVVPVIVDKCIRAVEALGMDYEGIYRKTGGSSQSKAITQLFERGDYDSFDLEDIDTFNDISSVTSVLKTYFRSLPDALLTSKLHESFIAAADIRDPRSRFSAMSAVVQELPHEHYYTVRLLMFHLHRVQARADQNRMNSRNLGVVFGPTLMRSGDPNAEFADMAGKALVIEWLIDNALEILPHPKP